MVAIMGLLVLPGAERANAAGSLYLPYAAGQGSLNESRGYHCCSGWDFSMAQGTPVRAAASGVIEVATNNNDCGGNFVNINHGSGLVTQYLHLQGFAPGIGGGVSVGAGNIIGYAGATGCATGAHLHFAVIKNGYVDPGNANNCSTGSASVLWTSCPAIPYPANPDSDGDGIPDSTDNCDNDPEDFNGYQDGDGCPDGGSPILGVLDRGGAVLAKQGGLTAEWVSLTGETKSLAIDRQTIVTLRTDGSVVAKAGISGEWTFLAGEGKAIAAGGNRIAMIRDDGWVQVKEGISDEWIGIIGEAKQVSLSGNRIAVLLEDGNVLAKDGIFGEWVGLTAGVQQVALDGDRILVLQNDSSLMAKDSMYGEWVFLAAGFKSIAAGGNIIGALNSNGVLQSKVGTYGEWYAEATQVCGMAIAGNWIVALQENDGVVAKDITVGNWLFEIGNIQQIALAMNAGAAASDQKDDDCDNVQDVADNCPSSGNTSQENSDAALGNGPSMAGDDITRPNSDLLGDACDPDIDNDGRLDADELAGTGCGGAITEVSTDISYSDGSPPSWDSDGDAVLDGAECALGTDPANSSDKPSAIACGGGGDDDGDGLPNSWETCKWGTSNSSADSDGDGLGDCLEVMDVNGNGVATNADAVAVKQAVFSVIIGDLAAMDINGNGVITNADAVFIQQAVFNVPPMDACF
jgi:hypothetical protein